jgi:perosamine synthetase
LRRLNGLAAHLATRRTHAARLLAALPEGGQLRELAYAEQDVPNYYNLVLVAPPDRAASVAAGFAAGGLPPDSIRFGYQPLYHQPIFTRYKTRCPNAEALCATTIQLPIHPAMSASALEWVADRIQVFAERQRP